MPLRNSWAMLIRVGFFLEPEELALKNKSQYYPKQRNFTLHAVTLVFSLRTAD